MEPRSFPPPRYRQEVWDAVPDGDRTLVTKDARWSLGVLDENRPLVNNALCRLSLPRAGGFCAAGYADAASSRASGARIVYSDRVGHQTSDIRLLWTAITQTINPPPPSPLVV